MALFPDPELRFGLEIKPVSEHPKPGGVRDYNHYKQNNYSYLYQAAPADA